MQLISNYSDEAYLRLLLQGPPGCGKTTLACQLPGVYVLDCDLNLAGALRWLRKNNKPLPIGFDIVDRNEQGSEIAPALRFARVASCLKAACADPNIKTIVIDGATKMHEYIQDEVLRQQNKSRMDIQMWGFYFQQWKHFIIQLASQRKHLVLIAHEKVDKDEVDATLKYFLMIPGQFGQIAGSLFTDIWRCEVAAVPFGMENKYKFNVRTMPDHRFNLKNSLGLPPVFEFDWNLIQAKLDEGKPKEELKVAT